MRRGVPVVSEDDHTDIVSLQVQGHTSDAGPELHHLTCLHFVQPHHSGNTVADTNHSTELLHIILGNIFCTIWVMFMILSWITFAVSAIPNFFEKGARSFRMLLIC